MIARSRAASPGRSRYRWVILGSCIVIMFISWGLGNHPIGLYSVPVTEAYGMSRSLFSVIFSLVNLFNAAGNFAFGALEKRLGLKPVMAAGAVLLAAGYGLFYAAAVLPVFYTAAALVGIGLALITNSPASVLANNWFGERKGLAIGIIFAASGIGGTVCDIVVGRMISSLGFKASLGVSALIIAGTLGIAVALIKPRAPVPPSQTRQSAAPVSGIAFRDALRTGSFWLVIATELLWGMSIIPVVANMPACLTDKGFDPIFISGVVMASLYAVSAASKLLLGLLNDRFGPRVMILLMCCAGTAATLLLAFVSTSAGAVASALCMGVAFSCMTIPVPLLTGRIFGNRDYAVLVGVFSAALTLAGAVASPVMNLVLAATGSYLPCFLAQAAFFAAAAFTALLAIRRPAQESTVTDR